MNLRSREDKEQFASECLDKTGSIRQKAHENSIGFSAGTPVRGGTYHWVTGIKGRRMAECYRSEVRATALLPTSL